MRTVANDLRRIVDGHARCGTGALFRGVWTLDCLFMDPVTEGLRFSPSALTVAPSRVSRVRHNDVLFKRAAVSLLNEVGWDHLSVRSVSKRCGLTPGAFYGRFEHMEDLASSMWESVLGDSICRPISVAIDALRANDEKGFVDAMHHFAAPPAEMTAAIELLEASLFDETLSQTVGAKFASFIDSCTSVERNEVVQATVAATVIYLALGLVLFALRPWTRGHNLDDELRRYFAALRAPGDPAKTPTAPIARYLYESPYETGDERLDLLLSAATTTFGELGFHKATVQKICKNAGVSKGFMMGRFASKLALFSTMTEMTWEKAISDSNEFILEAAAERGAGMAEAVAWRELQNPALRNKQRLAIETNRMMRLFPAIDALATAKELDSITSLTGGAPTPFIHTEMALGIGMVMASLFLPELCELPYSCITEALVASAPSG